MPDIVQEGSQKRDALPVRIRFPLAHNNFNKPARGMVDPDAVSETAVGRAGENQIRKSQLTDAAQPLELSGVQQTPRNPIRLVPVTIAAPAKPDQPVDRIADAICLLVVHYHRSLLG